jgi:SAM-dependent methyltransferase
LPPAGRAWRGLAQPISVVPPGSGRELTRKFSEIFNAHRGKASDKWQGYLPIYDSLFAAFAERPVSLLEIGVQNGGSLEIHDKFFPHADAIVGCDINPKCAELKFASGKISVVVGDCNQPATVDRIRGLCRGFDIVIDDGSHKSGDIIQSFLTYFPQLKPGGAFVIEDLCCSYWHGWSGGLLYEKSAMSFLKLLPDIVNREHWGVAAGASDILMDQFSEFAGRFDQRALNEIYAITFYNSLCVIRKNEREGDNRIGKRCVRGTEASVADGVLAVDGTEMMVDERANPNVRLPRSLR